MRGKVSFLQFLGSVFFFFKRLLSCLDIIIKLFGCDCLISRTVGIVCLFAFCLGSDVKNVPRHLWAPFTGQVPPESLGTFAWSCSGCDTWTERKSQSQDRRVGEQGKVRRVAPKDHISSEMQL